MKVVKHRAEGQTKRGEERKKTHGEIRGNGKRGGHEKKKRERKVMEGVERR